MHRQLRYVLKSAACVIILANVSVLWPACSASGKTRNQREEAWRSPAMGHRIDFLQIVAQDPAKWALALTSFCAGTW